MENWICTDPDNDQWRLDEEQDLWTDTKYTFREKGIKATVDLNDYDLHEINFIISMYDYYGDSENYFCNATGAKLSNDVIAECIFEYENELV